MEVSCYLCGGRSERAGEKNGHALYRCEKCALMFVHPLPPSTEPIYGKEYFEGAAHGFGYVHYDEDKEPMVPAFKKYLALTREALGSKGGTLLDVGAATGFFVDLANKAGFSAGGVEISGHAADVARKKGLRVKEGTLADISGTFDVITMLDVIEHVRDPRAELQRANERIRMGGLLVINTPDAGSLVARLMGGRWHAIVPPEHLYYFDQKNLSALLEETGFEILITTKVGKSFTLKYILKTLHKWTALWLFKWLAQLFSAPILSRLSLPLDLRDNMFIIARKV